MPPMTRLLKSQNLANCSPFSFLDPSPCFPITLSLPVLFSPTFALKSPVISQTRRQEGSTSGGFRGYLQKIYKKMTEMSIQKPF